MRECIRRPFNKEFLPMFEVRDMKETIVSASYDQESEHCISIGSQYGSEDISIEEAEQLVYALQSIISHARSKR